MNKQALYIKLEEVTAVSLSGTEVFVCASNTTFTLKCETEQEAFVFAKVLIENVNSVLKAPCLSYVNE